MAKRRNAGKSVHTDKYADKALIAQNELKKVHQRAEAAAEAAKKRQAEEDRAIYTKYCSDCGLVEWECELLHYDHQFKPLTKVEMAEREAKLEAAVGREMYAIAFYDPHVYDDLDESAVQLLHDIFTDPLTERERHILDEQDVIELLGRD